MIFNLQFWTLLVGLVAFVARFFFPALPFDNAQILAFVLFLLGLGGITPQVKAFGLTGADLIRSLSFWTLLAGLASFVIHYYLPAFPLDQAALLTLIVFVLSQFGIVPELRARGLRN